MSRRKGNPALPDIGALPPGTPCWIYVRASGGVKQGDPVPNQIAALEKEARRRDWVIVDRFVDRWCKGAGMARAELKRLLTRLEENPAAVPVLMIVDYRQVSRDATFCYQLMAKCHQARVTIHSLSFPLAAVMRDVGYLLPFNVTTATLQMSADVRRGLGEMIENGFAPGGRPPFGYMAEYHDSGTGGAGRHWPRWIFDPETETVARQRWQMRLQLASYCQIAAATGADSSPAQLHRFFGNPTYCGFPTWFLKHKGLNIVDCIDLPPIVPPYVTVQEWLRCRQPRGEH